MNELIKGIDIRKINKDKTYFNEDKVALEFIGNLNKINIFVGSNNSSKSRFLRSVLLDNNCYYYTCQIIPKTSEELSTIINNIYHQLQSHYYFPKKMEDLEYMDLVTRTMYFYHKLKHIEMTSSTNQLFEHKKRLLQVLEKLEYNVDNLFSEDYIEYKKVYIPILRGIENYDKYFEINEDENKNLKSISMNDPQRSALKKYRDNAKKIYLNKIVSVYNVPSEIIFNGEFMYDDVSAKLLGNKEDRQLISDFQDFISHHFYDDKPFEIVPQLNKKVVDVLIDGIEHPLYELGDGVKQLIVILYAIYINIDNRCLFFIEEPEINLHPGFQRKFIQLLQSDIFKNHQYFITTHSNHLIDSSLDYNNISLYKFVNNGKDKFSIINTTKRDIELLDQLGVSNSSVFLANCTIWVEGLSDKIIIKKYLDVYLKSINKDFKEDINYSFVEYGGNDICHWSFDDSDDDRINASGITNRAFMIVDNDNDTKKNRKQNLQRVFKDNYYELKVREIENTISKKILESIFKNRNSKCIKEYQDSEYQNKEIYMGSFIDEHYSDSKKWSYSKGTGTIRYKIEFAKLVSQNINDINDLSSEAKHLCGLLYNFIQNSNK